MSSRNTSYIQHPTSDVRTPERPNSPPFPHHLAIPAPAAPYNFRYFQNNLEERDAAERKERNGPAPPKLVVPGDNNPPAPAASRDAPVQPPKAQFSPPMAAPKAKEGHPLHAPEYPCLYEQCKNDGKALICGNEMAWKEHMWSVHGQFA